MNLFLKRSKCRVVGIVVFMTSPSISPLRQESIESVNVGSKGILTVEILAREKTINAKRKTKFLAVHIARILLLKIIHRKIFKSIFMGFK